jgi:hypothetical protein
MSRPNKVNPGQYKLGGRLTPDELGRERQRQLGQAAKAAPTRTRAAPTRAPAPAAKTPAGPASPRPGGAKRR